MQLYRNLGIRLKFLLVAAMFAVIVSLLALFVYQGVNLSQEREQQVAHTSEAVHTIDEISLHLLAMEMNYRRYLVTGDFRELDRYAANYDSYLAKQSELATMLRDSPTQVHRLIEINTQVETWRSDVIDAGVRIRRTLLALSVDQVAQADQALSAGKPTFDTIQPILIVMRDEEAKRNTSRLEQAAAAAANLRIFVIIGATVAGLLCVSLLLLLGTNIVRRVRRIAQATTAMTAGDMAVRCPPDRSTDELGRMSIAFNRLAETIEQRSLALQTQIAAADLARRDAERAHAEAADQLALIDQQRTLIQTMSIPILPLSDHTLVLPLVGNLDTQRLRLMQERALHELQISRARQLILDITGVPIVDETVAAELIQLMHAVQLLGAEVLIVGIRPEVAQAIVSTGLDFSQIRTFSSLQDGLGSR